MISRTNNPKRYVYLVTNCKKLSALARARGVGRSRATRDFKFWCELNGLDPSDFYISGYRDTGYWVPDEFIRWWDRILENQGRLNQADPQVINGLIAILNEFGEKLEAILPQVKDVNGKLGAEVERLLLKTRAVKSTAEFAKVYEVGCNSNVVRTFTKHS